MSEDGRSSWFVSWVWRAGGSVSEGHIVVPLGIVQADSNIADLMALPAALFDLGDESETREWYAASGCFYKPWQSAISESLFSYYSMSARSARSLKKVDNFAGRPGYA